MHLTLNGTVSDAAIKLGLTVIKDHSNLRNNDEHDMATSLNRWLITDTMEAAEDDAGNAKFVFDRCKISIEKQNYYRQLLAGW